MRFILPLILVVVVLVFAFSSPGIEDLIPRNIERLYIIEEDLDEQRLMSDLKSQAAVSVTYGIFGLENSRAILEILRYDTNFYRMLDSHLESETIFIGSEEIKIPCRTIKISEIEIKECEYSREGINVIKRTFPMRDKYVVRILCMEGSYEFAKERCNEISTEVLERGE